MKSDLKTLTEIFKKLDELDEKIINLRVERSNVYKELRNLVDGINEK